MKTKEFVKLINKIKNKWVLEQILNKLVLEKLKTTDVVIAIILKTRIDVVKAQINKLTK